MRSKLTAGMATVAMLAMTTAAAQAAEKPGAAVDGTAQVTATSATLKGRVNPKGSATTYFFQYGKGSSFTAQSGPASAGVGTKAVAVTAPVVGLEPATKYSFRIIATSAGGAVTSAAKSFTTPKQPLDFTLAAAPNPVPFGGATTVGGRLTGTGSAGRGIQLQQKAFPYTAGFANVGNPQVTDATGGFAFPILSLGINTQYRVVTTGANPITSPIALVGAAVVVRVAISDHSIKSGQLVRFAGTVTPRSDGALYAVQKQRGSTWVTVGGSSLRQDSATKSKFAKSLRIRHSGTYRIYVGVNSGAYVSSASSSQKISIKK